MGKLIVNSHNHKDALTIMFTYSKDAMNATETIQKTYTLEEFKEIANHGCQSGVCHEHIYYGDTVKFYEEFEDEILDYIESTTGSNDTLVDLFKDADASLTIYKNSVVWCFIEMIAMEVVDDQEYEYAMSYA